MSCRHLQALLCALLSACFMGTAPRAAEPEPVKKPFTLPEALRLALAGHPDLEAASARVRQAYAAELRLRADYWPRLSVLATTEKPVRLGRSGEDTSPLFSASAEGSWLLFDGLVREYRILAAKAGREMEEAAEEEARRLLRRAVSQAYFAALLAQLRMGLAAEDTTFNKELLARAEKRQEKGMASRSEMLNFEIQVGDAERVLLESGRDLAISLALLEVLLNDRLDLGVERTLLVTPEAAAPKADNDQLKAHLAWALAHRPDLVALEAAVRSAKAGTKAEGGTRWPSVEAVASYALEREDSPRFAHPRDATASVGLRLVWDVFDGGERKQRIAQAKAAESEQIAAYQSAVLDVTQELREIHDRLRYQQQLVERQRKTLAAATEDRKLVLALYESGHVTITRLNEVQRDYTLSAERLVTHEVLLQQAIEDLRIATNASIPASSGEKTP